jgi:Putative Ig domain
MNTEPLQRETEVFMRKILIFLFFSLALLACSKNKDTGTMNSNGGQPAGSAATAVAQGVSVGQCSMGITPAQADHNSVLTVVPNGFKLYDAKYEWTVNGEPVAGAISCTLKVCDCNAKRGDTVQAKAIISGRELMSGKVVIGDTPPEVSSVKLMPEVFKPGDTLYIDAQGKDMDGDQVTMAYEWTKNGQSAGTGKSIGCPVKRGDKITVSITPFDGERYGQPVVIEREIMNMPPSIVTDNKYDFAGGVLSYQVRAEDPDGDMLTYSLKSAPAGMSINPSTGLVTWRVPADFGGKTSFIVSASDGHGGEATQAMNFAVK